MATETEKRLIKVLEFLKEPQGSTISTIVKAVNGEAPQVSLKKIVQTLRGCLEDGILKVSGGRVKLKYVNPLEDSKPKEDREPVGSTVKGGSLKPASPDKATFAKKVLKAKGQKNFNRPGLSPLKCDEGDPPPEGGDGGDNSKCPECPKCKKKKKPKCRPKPKCPKPKPKCPKPKPKCPKPKPKCPKPKPKSKSKKPKCKPKKCSKKIKIQPYCKKKKKCVP